MKILRLCNSPGPTSAPYNQFSLGLKNQTEQTLLTLFPVNGLDDKGFEYFHGSGSILKMIKKI